MPRPAATCASHRRPGARASIAFGNGRMPGARRHHDSAHHRPGVGSVEPNGITLTGASITKDGSIASSGTAVVTSPALSSTGRSRSTTAR
jgi:hypothetical protein